MRNPFKRPKPIPRPQPPAKPKKGKCRIKFKKNPDGSEEFVATPECTDQQIKLAREYREMDRRGSEND